MRDICERYGQRYSTGRLGMQLGSVARRILRLSLPGPKQASPPSGRAPRAASVGSPAPAHAAAA